MIKDAKFWTYAPLEQSSTQKCSHVETSSPHQRISDELGNRVLFFTFSALPPFATKIISIRSNILIASTPHPMPLKDPGPFLRPETSIESEDPAILQLAETLRDENPSKTAARIFHWVTSSVRFDGYSSKNRGALYALRQKRGDCTEFMCLFVALCRSCGIPARGMAGYVCREDRILRPGDYHNWAEFYDKGAWNTADPQKGIFRANPAGYVAMRVIGETKNSLLCSFDRFRCEGEGVTVKME